MWLVYPVTPDDIRHARRGVALLWLASALWFAVLGVVLFLWSGSILYKIQSKFAPLPYEPTHWTSVLTLMGTVVLTGLMRFSAYRLMRNAGGAAGAGDGLVIASVGTAVWVCTIGMLYFGFSGLIAVMAAISAVAELRFVRFPAALFGLVVSEKAVGRVTWYYWARTAWLALVVFTGLIMLAAHVIGEPLDGIRASHGLDRPLEGESPEFRFWTNLRDGLRVLFNAMAMTAIVTLPVVVGAYWAILWKTYRTVPKLLDPNAPLAPTPPPDREGYDYLKTVLRNPGL